MHILHKILVYNEDGFDSMAENERISSARSMAENSTDSYFGDAYDWRETETAGSWSEDYNYGSFDFTRCYLFCSGVVSKSTTGIGSNI